MCCLTTCVSFTQSIAVLGSLEIEEFMELCDKSSTAHIDFIANQSSLDMALQSRATVSRQERMQKKTELAFYMAVRAA